MNPQECGRPFAFGSRDQDGWRTSVDARRPEGCHFRSDNGNYGFALARYDIAGKEVTDSNQGASTGARAD